MVEQRRANPLLDQVYSDALVDMKYVFDDAGLDSPFTSQALIKRPQLIRVLQLFLCVAPYSRDIRNRWYRQITPIGRQIDNPRLSWPDIVGMKLHHVLYPRLPMRVRRP